MASSHSRYKGIAHVTVKLWNALVFLLPVPRDQMARFVVKEERAKMEFVHVTSPTSPIQELIILLFLVQAVNVTISFVTMDLKDLFVEEMEFVNVLMEHTVVHVQPQQSLDRKLKAQHVSVTATTALTLSTLVITYPMSNALSALIMVNANHVAHN